MCFFSTAFFFSCKDDSSDIIIISGNNNDDEQEEPDSTQNSSDSTDTTATNETRNWDLFRAYSCYDGLNSDELNILTWNIEWFPKSGNSSIDKVAQLIADTDADLIAMQEIDNNSALNNLIDKLPGWDYKLYDVRYDQDIAFLYKTSEITSITNPYAIYSGNSSAFPRQPVVTTIKHKNGQEITLFNIHLKCCNEGVARRRTASQLLKSYVDDNMANEKVIILGDFNDEIDDNSTPFLNFVEDSARWYFADMEIAKGSYQYWSYPGYGQYGSHIDHILLSNELFEDVLSITTLAYDNCISSYDGDVSDHRPVMVTIK